MTKLLPHEVEERAAEAQAVLGSKFFEEVLEELNQEYLTTLIQAEVGGLTALHAHASMKALVDVKAKLQSKITDQKFLARRK